MLGRWGVGVGVWLGGVCGVCAGLRGACAGCAWGVRWACVWAKSVGIARSALLSGYLGKSGHLPRFKTSEASSITEFALKVKFIFTSANSILIKVQVD